ncbi:hypothetical protein P8C59_000799 [Phyllachora maydis]|uniref:Uncharacterized protein n=1 Tax=Phyllachora maydis TaxID=1825666 RepID=A0AAD9HY05_9PEZI|nr:hypothetical protein P8C59_000799 [Phyllachora maydis]
MEKGLASRPHVFPNRGRRASPTRRCAILALAALCLFLFYRIRPLSDTSPDRPREASLADNNHGRPVALEAHIISKCPDTRDCLRDLIIPAMEVVHDKVNFTLSYIGTPTDNDGVACKHGPEECLGNIVELCAQELYPDPKVFLGFTMCLTKDYQHIPQRNLIEDCALEHAVSFQQLNECATQDDGAFGMGMLRDSVQRTSAAGITKSCTVRVDEKIYCIRDGGEWIDCPSGSSVDTLVATIEKLSAA